MRNETDPRRRDRRQANARDRHAVSMLEPAPALGTLLTHLALQLRLIRERILG